VNRPKSVVFMLASLLITLSTSVGSNESAGAVTWPKNLTLSIMANSDASLAVISIWSPPVAWEPEVPRATS